MEERTIRSVFRELRHSTCDAVVVSCPDVRSRTSRFSEMAPPQGEKRWPVWGNHCSESSCKLGTRHAGFRRAPDGLMDQRSSSVGLYLLFLGRFQHVFERMYGARVPRTGFERFGLSAVEDEQATLPHGTRCTSHSYFCGTTCFHGYNIFQSF